MGQKTVYRAAQIASSEPCSPDTLLSHLTVSHSVPPGAPKAAVDRRRRRGATLPKRQWQRRLQGKGVCEAPPTAATSGGGGRYERWRRLRRVSGCEILKSPLQFSSSPISTTNSKWQSPWESNLASFFSAHITFSSLLVCCGHL